MAGAAAQAVEHLSVPRPSGGAPVRCLRRAPAAKGRGPGLVYLPGLLSSSGGCVGGPRVGGKGDSQETFQSQSESGGHGP